MQTVRRRLPVADTMKRMSFSNPICSMTRRCLSSGVPKAFVRDNTLPRLYSLSPPTRPVPLRTFYYGWLTEEDYVDLSDARGLIVDPRSVTPEAPSPNAPYVTYGRSEFKTPDAYHIKYFPFPVNTRGHLYFWRHPRFPIGGAVRFRLMQNPEDATFTDGWDLQTEHGLPWQIPLLTLASSDRYKVVRDVLQLDGYVLDGVFERLQDMCKGVEGTRRIGEHTQYLYNTMQPFVLNLARPKSGVVLVGEKDLIPVDQKELFSMKRSWKPFTSGIILCRFETQGDSSVYLRVLRIIEPVRMRDEYPGPINPPVVGDLIRKERKGKPMKFLQTKEDGSLSKYAMWTRRDPTSQWAHLWDWGTYRRRAWKQGVHFPYDKEAIPPPSARW